MKPLSGKISYRDIVYLCVVAALLALSILLEAPVGILAAVYLVSIGALGILLYIRFEKWWLPLTLGLIILLPGPLDRIFFSVELSPERAATPYPVFTVVDFLMLLGIAIIAKRQKNLRAFFKVPINYLIAALLLMTVIAIISAFVAAANSPTFYWPMAVRAIFYTLRFLLVFIWVSLLFRHLGSFKQFLLALVLICLGFCFLVFVSLMQGGLGGEQRLSVATYGVNTFGHLLTFISLLCIPLISHYFLRGRRTLLLLAAGCFICCVSFLLMSGSRMSFALILVGGGAFYLFMPGSFRKKVRWSIAAACTMLVALAMLAVVKPEVYTRITGLFQLLSGQNVFDDIRELQARFVVWNISFDMIRENMLLGVGPGQWNYMKGQFGLMPPWMGTILDPHNGYLLYAAEMGLVYMLLYYSIIVKSVIRGWRAFRQLKIMYLAGFDTNIRLYMSMMLMLSIVVICWMLADLSNASALNIRVQSLMWSFCAMLYISPMLVKKIKSRNEN